MGVAARDRKPTPGVATGAARPQAHGRTTIVPSWLAAVIIRWLSAMRSVHRAIGQPRSPVPRTDCAWALRRREVSGTVAARRG